MLNELYTFAEPVQVVPFSNLKWGKFTLLHTHIVVTYGKDAVNVYNNITHTCVNKLYNLSS